jgi:hypothetical protein
MQANRRTASTRLSGARAKTILVEHWPRLSTQVLQALPLDGKIVCREITDEEIEPQQRGRNDTARTGQSGRRR